MDHLTLQQTYEDLKKALKEDIKTGGKNDHGYIYAYVAGMLKGMEQCNDVFIVGDPIVLTFRGKEF